MYRLAIIGHRPMRAYGSFHHHPDRANIILAKMQQHILDVQIQHHPLRIFTTMTIGPSTDAAVLAHAYGISFEAYCPYPSYAHRWPQNAIAICSTYAGRAAHSEFVSPDPPAPYKYHKANRKMIDLCDEVYFVWDGHPGGGTYEALKYANELAQKNHQTKPVIRVHELWTENWQPQGPEFYAVQPQQQGIYIQQNAPNNIQFNAPGAIVFDHDEQPF